MKKVLHLLRDQEAGVDLACGALGVDRTARRVTDMEDNSFRAGDLVVAAVQDMPADAGAQRATVAALDEAGAGAVVLLCPHDRAPLPLHALAEAEARGLPVLYAVGAPPGAKHPEPPNGDGEGPGQEGPGPAARGAAAVAVWGEHLTRCLERADGGATTWARRLRALATETGGQSILLDSGLRLLNSAPSGPVPWLHELKAALPATALRDPTYSHTFSLGERGERLVRVRCLGLDGQVAGVLAGVVPRGTGGDPGTVWQRTATLLSADLQRGLPPRSHQLMLQHLLFEKVLNGILDTETYADVIEAAGMPSAAPYGVLLLQGASTDVLRAALDTAWGTGRWLLCWERPVGLVLVGRRCLFLDSRTLVEETARVAGIPLYAGVAEASSRGALAQAFGQARVAAVQARECGQRVVWYQDLALGELWRSVVDPHGLDAFRRAVEHRLAGEHSEELLATLRTWLAEGGQNDRTAARLRVHRHTVRHRLRRAEVALGQSLDDPSVRVELWLALGMAGHPHTSPKPPGTS